MLINGIEYTVRFGHYHDGRAVEHLCGGLMSRAAWDVSHVTVCLIGDEARGVAFCCRTDNFSKEAGRRLAFKRALKALAPADKGLREQFWRWYRARGEKVQHAETV